MHVLTDAYALGIAQGTGLTRHAHELLEVHKALGYRRALFFGAPVPRVVRALRPSVVFQSVFAEEQQRLLDTPLTQLSAIAGRVARQGLGALLPHAARMHELKADPAVFFSDTSIDIESFDLFNSGGLFRAAFAWAALSGRNLSTNFPAGLARPDLIHCTSPVPVRLRGIPRVTTVHDLIPITLPQSTRIPLHSYYRIMRASLRHCMLRL